MRLHTPSWWTHDGWISKIMAPLGSLFGAAGDVRRFFSSAKRSAVPVLCVGNLVAGGAGKTPTCLALADILLEDKRRVAFLARGYGGKLKGPVRVDPDVHTIADVGDEALLLAAKAPTVIAADRAAGAELAGQKSDIIILDDGFQNPGLEKDFSLVVIDGSYGFGNGKLIPAGPLRETLDKGMRRASAVLMIGEDLNNLNALIGLKYDVPILNADLQLDPIPNLLLNRPLVAFAGIGRPEKFFEAIRAQQGDVVDSLSFPDHYTYTERDTNKLEKLALVHGAALVTTTKDYMRLSEPFKSMVRPLPARLIWRNTKAVRMLLKKHFPGA